MAVFFLEPPEWQDCVTGMIDLLSGRPVAGVGQWPTDAWRWQDSWFPVWAPLNVNIELNLVNGDSVLISTREKAGSLGNFTDQIQIGLTSRGMMRQLLLSPQYGWVINARDVGAKVAQTIRLFLMLMTSNLHHNWKVGGDIGNWYLPDHTGFGASILVWLIGCVTHPNQDADGLRPRQVTWPLMMQYFACQTNVVCRINGEDPKIWIYPWESIPDLTTQVTKINTLATGLYSFGVKTTVLQQGHSQRLLKGSMYNVAPVAPNGQLENAIQRMAVAVKAVAVSRTIVSTEQADLEPKDGVVRQR